MAYRPPTHGILTPLTMVYRPPYPWYIDPPTHGISTTLTMVFRPPTHGILTPLPMVYRPPTHGISTPLTMVYRPPTHGILTPLPMVYRPPNHGISTPYPWHIDPPTHGISTPLPMVYRPPCPWNIDPPTYGISNPLLWYYELFSFGRNGGGVNLPWGGSKYNDKKLTPRSKYHMENWTRGPNIIGKSTPGSIYHGVQNTIWHRYIIFEISGKPSFVEAVFMTSYVFLPSLLSISTKS